MCGGYSEHAVYYLPDSNFEDTCGDDGSPHDVKFSRNGWQGCSGGELTIKFNKVLTITNLKVAGLKSENTFSVLTEFRFRFSIDGVDWNKMHKGSWDWNERVSQA